MLLARGAAAGVVFAVGFLLACSAAASQEPGRHAEPGEARAARYLRLGDEAAAGGWHDRARRFWRRATRLDAANRDAARGRLIDLARAVTFPSWKKVRSAHFILHAAPDSPAARDPWPLLSRREEVYANIDARLGVAPDGPITIYVYASSRQAHRLLGRPLAFADPPRREIHVRHDQQPGHEEAHVFAWAWNRRGSGVQFLEEGLAVALSAHPGSPHAAAAETAARGFLPPLQDLIERFPEYRQGYVLAGSFVADLLERHGVDTVRALYVGDEGSFIERLQATTASSLPLLQAAWETAVASASRGAASREPIIEALSLLRLNRVDEAVAMLERRREEHPDNPVVEYALAHARRENGDTAGSATSYRRLLAFALPYHLAWMRERARQALQELEAQEPAAEPSRSTP